MVQEAQGMRSGRAQLGEILRHRVVQESKHWSAHTPVAQDNALARRFYTRSCPLGGATTCGDRLETSRRRAEQAVPLLWRIG